MGTVMKTGRQIVRHISSQLVVVLISGFGCTIQSFEGSTASHEVRKETTEKTTNAKGDAALICSKTAPPKVFG